jgi:hypothetical protein
MEKYLDWVIDEHIIRSSAEGEEYVLKAIVYPHFENLYVYMYQKGMVEYPLEVVLGTISNEGFLQSNDAMSISKHLLEALCEFCFFFTHVYIKTLKIEGLDIADDEYFGRAIAEVHNEIDRLPNIYTSLMTYLEDKNLLNS